MFFVILALLGGVFFKWFPWRPYSFILLLFGVSIGTIQQQFQQDSVIGDSIEYWSVLPANKLLLYFIPPIIYQAALFVNFHMFKKLFVLVMVLSCLGVITTFLLSTGFIYGIDSRFRNSRCWLLACVLSAIDPVSITSVLSEVKLSEKLSNLIEIESLFNDEIALLIFYFLVKFLLYSSSTPYLIGQTIKQIGGSICISLCVMIIQLVLLRKVYGDFTAQLTLSLCSCYLAYFVSEYTILDTSGILSVLVLGLCMSGFGRTRLRPENLEQFYLVWNILSQYSTILIFTISGLILSYSLNIQDLQWMDAARLLGLYLFLNIIRGGVCWLFHSWMEHHLYHYDKVDFFIMSMSGLRGEISLALSFILYHQDEIDFKIRNLILFYVSGVVVLTLSINVAIVRWLVHYFHRDRIRINAQQLQCIHSHLDKEGSLYLETLKDTDFHLSKVDFGQVRQTVFPHLEPNDIEEIDMTNKEMENNIFLNTLKKTIWTLFEHHVLHYEVVMKLLDITDSALDSSQHSGISWNVYMNDYCQKEHIQTPFICLLENTPILKHYLKPYLIYHRIEYNYNLILGYMLSLEDTLEKVEDIVDDPVLINEIQQQVESALILPQSYVRHLEERYVDVLQQIETRQVSLLVISKQKSHLQQLMKNGEISERTCEILMMKLDKKESKVSGFKISEMF